MKAHVYRGRDGWFSINCPESWEDCYLGGFGSSFQDAKADLRECARSRGVPDSVKFEWIYDISAFFYCHPYLRVSEVAKRAGIAPAQMRRYACALSEPRPGTLKKIIKALTDIGGELSALRLEHPGIS